MRILLLVGVLGCGRAGFDEHVDARDARDAVGMVDAAPPCDLTKPFGAPVQAEGLNDPTAYDSSFTLAHDELSGYFYSDRGGNFDIYRATRPDRASAWSVTHVEELASPSLEQEPSLSPDGSLLAFTTTRPPNDGSPDIWYATFDGATFTIGGPISSIDSSGTDYHPFFQDESDVLWYSSNVAGPFSIYRATHAGTTFSAGTLQSDLDVAGSNSGAAVPSGDGLTMYFRSDRPETLGNYDVFVATRSSLAAAFEPAVDVVEVSSAALDTPNWVSPDGCRLYLSSSRDDPSDIYVATKP